MTHGFEKSVMEAAAEDDGFNLLFTLPVGEFAQKRNHLKPISLKDLLRLSNKEIIDKVFLNSYFFFLTSVSCKNLEFCMIP